ncbi:hypothetical protein S83_015419 [Arachis hypogaea]
MGYLEDSGPYFGFTVVLPGDLFEVELDATGYFCLNEKATQEDAALEILGYVFEIIGKKICNCNYEKVKLLHDTNNALRAKVHFWEESYERFKASYQNLANAHIGGNSP